MNFLQCSSFLTICAVQQPCNIAAPPWLKSQLVSLFRAMWALARHQEGEAESLPSEEEDAIVAAAPQKSRPMPRTSLTPTAALRREWMQPPVAVTPDQDEAKDKDKPKNTRYSQKGPPHRKSPASSTIEACCRRCSGCSRCRSSFSGSAVCAQDHWTGSQGAC